MKWLNKENNNNLIIFLNGWGMDNNFLNLSYNNYDFVVFNEYNNINDYTIDTIFYDEVYVIGWSMGVIFINSLNLLNLNKIKRIAINGTLKIIDNKYGINIKVFNRTLENLNNKTIIDFYNNMFIKNNVNKFNFPKRDIKSQKDELKFIKDFYNNNYNKISKNTIDFSIVGKYDRIVPYTNQINFLNDYKIKYRIINCAHYIFNFFNSWQEIIDYVCK